MHQPTAGPVRRVASETAETQLNSQPRVSRRRVIAAPDGFLSASKCLGLPVFLILVPVRFVVVDEE